MIHQLYIILDPKLPRPSPFRMVCPSELDFDGSPAGRPRTSLLLPRFDGTTAYRLAETRILHLAPSFRVENDVA